MSENIQSFGPSEVIKDYNIDNAQQYVHFTEDENGSLNMNISYLDPDAIYFQDNNLSAENICESWLKENYPGKNMDSLAEKGITINYVGPKEKYVLYGNEVSKSEYENYLESTNYSDISHYENEDKIIVAEMGDDNIVHNVEKASYHVEPGHVEVVVNTSVTGEKIQEISSKELTGEQAVIIGGLCEKLGIANDVVSKGETVRGAYKEITGALKEKSSAGTLTTATKLKVSLAIVSVSEGYIIDAMDIEGILDADDSELLAAIDSIAKITGSTVTIIGALELATGGAATLAIAAVGLIATLVDMSIKDKDEQEIVTINDNDEIEYNLGLLGSAGNVRFSGEILVPDDPITALNEVYAYIESAKLVMMSHLTILNENRQSYIDNVKDEIEFEMIDLSLTDKSQLQAYVDIYGIEGGVIWPVENDDAGYIYGDTQTTGFENISKIAVDTEGDEFKYVLEFTHIIGEQVVIDLLLGQNPNGIANMMLSTPEYEGVDIMSEVIFIGDSIPTSDRIKEIVTSYCKKYYNYYKVVNESKKDDFIQDLADENNVNVNVVNVSFLGNEYFEELPTGEGANVLGYTNNKSNVNDEATEFTACYMSNDRNALAQYLVHEYYQNILDIGWKHTDFINQMVEFDEQISMWDSDKS